MTMCENCPRRGEPKGRGRDDVRGKSAGTRGTPSTAKLLVGGMSPGRDELSCGIPFVGGSGRILASCLSTWGMKIEDIYIVNTVNCYPMGPGGTLTKDQKLACRGRFAEDTARFAGGVALALGGDALEALTGLRGVKNGISHWRGYLIGRDDFAAEATLTLLPSVGTVVASYHPAYVMRTGLKELHWLRRDVGRAVRAVRGELVIEKPPLEDSKPPGLPPSMPPRIAFDIETEGFSTRITQIGLAWEEESLDTGRGTS